jgi:hypothetical protein
LAVVLSAVLVALFASLAQARPPATFPIAHQSLIEPVSNVCSSTSSVSRRCHFTFNRECKARKESADHCKRMTGSCHACTDQYVACKKAAKRKNCAGCNTAYSACIATMVKTYGGRLSRAH